MVTRTSVTRELGSPATPFFDSTSHASRRSSSRASRRTTREPELHPSNLSQSSYSLPPTPLTATFEDSLPSAKRRRTTQRSVNSEDRVLPSKELADITDQRSIVSESSQPPNGISSKVTRSRSSIQPDNEVIVTTKNNQDQAETPSTTKPKPTTGVDQSQTTLHTFLLKKPQLRRKTLSEKAESTDSATSDTMGSGMSHQRETRQSMPANAGVYDTEDLAITQSSTPTSPYSTPKPSRLRDRKAKSAASAKVSRSSARGKTTSTPSGVAVSKIADSQGTRAITSNTPSNESIPPTPTNANVTTRLQDLRSIVATPVTEREEHDQTTPRTKNHYPSTEFDGQDDKTQQSTKLRKRNTVTLTLSRKSLESVLPKPLDNNEIPRDIAATPVRVYDDNLHSDYDSDMYNNSCRLGGIDGHADTPNTSSRSTTRPRKPTLKAIESQESEQRFRRKRTTSVKPEKPEKSIKGKASPKNETLTQVGLPEPETPQHQVLENEISENEASRDEHSQSAAPQSTGPKRASPKRTVPKRKPRSARTRARQRKESQRATTQGVGPVALGTRLYQLAVDAVSEKFVPAREIGNWMQELQDEFKAKYPNKKFKAWKPAGANDAGRPGGEGMPTSRQLSFLESLQNSNRWTDADGWVYTGQSNQHGEEYVYVPHGYQWYRPNNTYGDNELPQPPLRLRSEDQAEKDRIFGFPPLIGERNIPRETNLPFTYENIHEEKARIKAREAALARGITVNRFMSVAEIQALISQHGSQEVLPSIATPKEATPMTASKERPSRKRRRTTTVSKTPQPPEEVQKPKRRRQGTVGPVPGTTAPSTAPSTVESPAPQKSKTIKLRLTFSKAAEAAKAEEAAAAAAAASAPTIPAATGKHAKTERPQNVRSKKRAHSEIEETMPEATNDKSSRPSKAQKRATSAGPSSATPKAVTTPSKSRTKAKARSNPTAVPEPKEEAPEEMPNEISNAPTTEDPDPAPEASTTTPNNRPRRRAAAALMAGFQQHADERARRANSRKKTVTSGDSKPAGSPSKSIPITLG